MRNIIDKITNLIISIILIGVIFVVITLLFNVYQFLNLKEVPVGADALGSTIDSGQIAEKEAANPGKEAIAADTQNPYASSESENRTVPAANESGFYYKQLDEYAKILYDEIKKNENQFKTGQINIDFGTRFNTLLNQPSGDTILNNAYQEAFNTFLIDTPGVFYIDITKIYLMIKSTTRGSTTTYEVSINNKENETCYNAEFGSSEQVASAIAKIEEIENSIISEAKGNTYEKVKYVHDWLVDHVEYDRSLSKANTYNIYGTLVERQVVCEGYARTLKHILDRMNIPCIIVVGEATNSEGKTESHAWNYVQIDNKWYGIDVTWDDPIIIGGGTLTNNLKYRYFLKGTEVFERHVASGKLLEGGKQYTYPVLNSGDF